MPIHVRDPWRVQYFDKVYCPPHVHVPVDDIDCFEWFPQWRFVYDKLFIARSQGVVCGDGQSSPPAYPVFAKPQLNLHGMGLQSRAIRDGAEFKSYVGPNMMWMELFQGEHISTDCVIVSGEIHWLRHSLGHAWRDGMFKFWTVECGTRADIEQLLRNWVRRYMRNYTGMMNFESIGGRLIEAHLRFSDQWCDLNGDGWIEAVVALYGGHSWTFSTEPRIGYSVPLFAEHGAVPGHPPDSVQDEIRSREEISSLQLTFSPSKAGEDHPMPPGGFRLAIVNCWSLAAGQGALRDLASAISECEILWPD